MVSLRCFIVDMGIKIHFYLKNKLNKNRKIEAYERSKSTSDTGGLTHKHTCKTFYVYGSSKKSQKTFVCLFDVTTEITAKDEKNMPKLFFARFRI